MRMTEIKFLENHLNTKVVNLDHNATANIKKNSLEKILKRCLKQIPNQS